VIFARASSEKSSTVRHKLDLGAVVAVCWNCDAQTGVSASLRSPGGQAAGFRTWRRRNTARELG
jgi:hypothetical protein